MSEIIGRAEAKARGLKRYFTGKPCCRGHVAERVVLSAHCLDCASEYAPKWRKRNLEKARKSSRECARKLRALRPERYQLASRKYNEKNREKRLADSRKRYPQRIERMRKLQDLLAALKSITPDLMKEFGL